MGNRLIKNENGEITKYEYGPCNELLAEIPQNGAATRYEYDDCGRLISETKENQITKRQWDAESRLTAIHAPDGKTETSLYNSDGLRIAKMSEDKKYFYVWDGQNVLAETDDSGNSTALWTHANKQWGTMISERRGEKSYTFGFDPLSNTRVLTNANGAIVETFNYDAFGVNKATAESIIPTPFQYGGEQGCWRDGANMYYVRARHLNVASGRWISRDPLGFAGRDLNLYRFVNNAPVLLLDPSGAFHCTNYKTCTLLATGVDIKDKKVQTLITCMINAGGSTNEMYKCIAAYGKSVATTSLCNYVGCIAATNETGTVMHSGNVYCDTCTSTCGSTTYCSECCDEKYYQAACNCAVKSASLSDFGDCMITPLKNKANCETNCPN
jgi:RHS repeat-associated protein